MLDDTAQQSAIFFPVVERPAAWLDKSGTAHKIPKQKVLVRPFVKGQTVVGYPLAIVGTGYTVIPMSDLVNSVEQEIERCLTREDRESMIINDKVARHGQTCIREYLFPHTERTIGRYGKTGLRLCVVNGYGGSAVKIIGGAIDFMCTNGMILGTFDSTYQRHSSGLTLNKVTRHIEQCIEAFQHGVVKWKNFARTEVTDGQAMQLLKDIATSPRMFDHLHEQYERETQVRGSNLWAIVSSLTYFATHGKVKQTENDSEAITRLERDVFVSEAIKKHVEPFQLALT